MISSRRAFYPFRNGKKAKELGGVGGMERVSDPVVLCRHVAGPELVCQRRASRGSKLYHWRL